MREIKVWRCEVDLYRNGTIFRSPKDRLYDRGNTGVWFVAAKSAKEAKKLLQNHIKFGSVNIPKHQWIPECYCNLPYKKIQKMGLKKRYYHYQHRKSLAIKQGFFI